MSQRPVSSQPPQSIYSGQRPPSSQPPQQSVQPQQRPPSSQTPQPSSQPQQRPPSSQTPQPQSSSQPQQRPPAQPSSQPQQRPPPAQDASSRQQSAMPVRSDVERVMPSKSTELPIDGTMIYAMQLALKKDKPIILTFWMDSLEKKICFLHDETEKETILFKSPEEYTSPMIQKYNNKTDVICETENSLYIIRAGMETRNA